MMHTNRAARRARKANAVSIATTLSALCYDFREDGTAVRVSDAKAVAALKRAFVLMLRADGNPVAVPLSDVEAQAFIDGSVTWLAVGLDPDNRGAYALQSAKADSLAVAHDAARALALARLSDVSGSRGFPAFQMMRSA